MALKDPPAVRFQKGERLRAELREVGQPVRYFLCVWLQ